MPQNMGQWGSGQWASNFGQQTPSTTDPGSSSFMTHDPGSPSTPTPGSDPSGGIAGPLGNGQQNNTPFITPAAGTTLGGGGGGWAGGGGGDSPWQGNMVQTADGPDWVGAEPSWTSSFEDGGVIGDSDVTGPVTDPAAAITSVQKALAAGRQSMGLPASLFGATDSDGDDDGDSDSDNDSDKVAANIPARPAGPGGEGEDQNPFQTKTAPSPFGKRKQVPGAAAGGVIDAGDMDDPSSAGSPPQPTDNQPTGSGAGAVNMQALKQYVMGAGAMPADQAAALEQQADPQGQMDPAQRKLLAVANAGDPKAQFGLLQHYRQRFNLLNAYAQAAAKGAQGRPADLAESTQAATRATQNVPTGHSVNFQPAGNGVAVSIKKLGAGKQQPGLDAGGVVPTSDDQTDTEAPAQDTPEDSLRSAAGEPAIPAESGSETLGQIGKFVLSIPQYLSYLTQTNYDALHDKGPEQVAQEAAKAPAQQPAQGVVPTGAQPPVADTGGTMPTATEVANKASGLPSNAQYTPAKQEVSSGLPDIPGYDKDLINRAYHAVGEIGSPRFYDYLERLTSARTTNEQQLRLEQARADANAKLWGVRNDAAAARNANTVEGRLQVAMLNLTGRQQTTQQNDFVRLIGQQIAANPRLANDPQGLLKVIAPFAAAAGVNPRNYVQQFMQAGQQPAQQPAQGGQGQPPVPGAKFYQGQWYVRGANGAAVPYQGQ